MCGIRCPTRCNRQPLCPTLFFRYRIVALYRLTDADDWLPTDLIVLHFDAAVDKRVRFRQTLSQRIELHIDISFVSTIYAAATVTTVGRRRLFLSRERPSDNGSRESYSRA